MVGAIVIRAGQDNMGETKQLTAIERKAGAGRGESDTAGMTPAKALRLALSRSAQEELSLPLRVQGLTETRVNQPGLLSELSDDLLLLLLEGHQGGAGLVALDIDTLAALIEVQTMGQVLKSPAVQRQTTVTDSAMCEPFLDRLLQEFAKYLEGSSAALWATGFRFAEPVESVRLLGLRIDEADYRLFRVSMDYADGAKQGEMLLALPADGGLRMKEDPAGGQDWAQMLQKAVQASHVELRAILHRVQMPLAKASAFKPGDLVQVPQNAIGAVQLEGIDGRIVGVARLGQQNGNKALRISACTVPGALADGAGDMAKSASGGDPDTLTHAVDDRPMTNGDTAPERPMLAAAQDGVPDLPMARMDGSLENDVDHIGEMPMAAMPMDMEIG